jgi:hypothetical protein
MMTLSTDLLTKSAFSLDAGKPRFVVNHADALKPVLRRRPADFKTVRSLEFYVDFFLFLSKFIIGAGQSVKKKAMFHVFSNNQSKMLRPLANNCKGNDDNTKTAKSPRRALGHYRPLCASR